MTPKISILVPLYNTPENFLREMTESVIGQTYKNWELCLADASDAGHEYVKNVVKEYALQHKGHVRYKRLKENKGISENTNECISLASGDYFALLDHDDVLDKRALEKAAGAIIKEKADFVYSDEAKFTTDISDWFAPNYKPDFSKYELRAHNYICHLTVYSRALLEQVGLYRKECDGSQDHDMVLRLTEKARKIVHIPSILYYWRVHEQSVSSGVQQKSYAVDAAKKAVLDQVERAGEKGSILTHDGFSLLYDVCYEIEEKARITVILSGQERPVRLKELIETVENNSEDFTVDYVLLVKNGQEKDVSCETLPNNDRIRVVSVSFSDKADVNEAVCKTAGEYLLFLNWNTSIESEGFLRKLLELASRKDVAFAGPKILSADYSIHSAGVAVSGAADFGLVYRCRGEYAEADGYEAMLRHIRGVTALSKECLMISKNKFKELGGFSSRYRWYAAEEACIRAVRAGYWNLWTPYAVLTSYEAVTAPGIDEQKLFKKEYKKLLGKEDPFYNKAVRYDVDNLHDKNTPVQLVKKSVRALKEDGIAGLKNRISVFSGRSGIHTSLHMSYTPVHMQQHVFKDVLFVNGCAPQVPHPSRYRVMHQKEQLDANGISSDVVYYENIHPDMIRFYRLVIIFRCPYIEPVGELIRKARELNRPILYDIDDLVIDTKYTDTIPFIQTFNEEQKRGYDDGVIRMGKTLGLCDAVITTTEGMAEELSHYSPEVFINRNVASERMYELSEQAVFKRDRIDNADEKNLPKWMTKKMYLEAVKDAENRRNGHIRMGYFSGSITHNADFEMILPAVIRVLKENPEAELHLAGELSLPEELKPFEDQIHTSPFVDWEKLPDMIASVDINLAPIVDSIFNRAKSENKWTEAALVKVPTIASSIGAFSRMIKDGETGILCDTPEEWYTKLNELIHEPEKRKAIAEKAYQYVVKNCVTTYTGRSLAEYIKGKMTPDIAFVLPSLNISGGIMVAMEHASILKKSGKDVMVINQDRKEGYIRYKGTELPVYSIYNTVFQAKIDHGVATFWETLSVLEANQTICRRSYLVQNYETDFYEPGDKKRLGAESTYCKDSKVEYLTISYWCRDWLKDRYGHEADYIPNGINLQQFKPQKREFNGRVRILIEGDSEVYYKNVDESFRIADRLDPEKYEIVYLSYNGKYKNWYRVDQFFHRIPHEEVDQIYRNCDILIKSSLLESFSYPPLEMMATGGYAVVAPNGGNREYLKDGENCLLYKQGDIEDAVEKIERICNDPLLRAKLYDGGIATARSRDWHAIADRVKEVYK